MLSLGGQDGGLVALNAWRKGLGASDMEATGLIALTTAILLGLGLLEAWLHRRALAQIPIRIHVNGTRGKSSVTRLIAAGLREAGIVTCAKSTGTLARMIMPDGREFPVFRPSHPNVIEQIRIVRTAAAYRAQALVIECMALQPHLQWLCENKLVRATHGVITNARADHLDVMGPTETDVAWALAGMTPIKGVLFTAERRRLEILKHACDDRQSRLVAIGDSDVSAVTVEDLSGFHYVEHAENVALALRVLAEIGVDKETALRGMWRSTPDPGVMTAHELHFFGRTIYFVNGFAANDPESTERIWNIACERFPHAQRRIAVFNCRADRPERSAQLGQACAHWRRADHYVLIGSGTFIFGKYAADEGLDMMKILFAENRRVDEIFELIIDLCGPSALVMGMGNIGGPGLDVIRYFRNRGMLITPPAPRPMVADIDASAGRVEEAT